MFVWELCVQVCVWDDALCVQVCVWDDVLCVQVCVWDDVLRVRACVCAWDAVGWGFHLCQNAHSTSRARLHQACYSSSTYRTRTLTRPRTTRLHRITRMLLVGILKRGNALHHLSSFPLLQQGRRAIHNLVFEDVGWISFRLVRAT